MIRWEDIFLLFFIVDYLMVIFCRIADRTRLVEVYNGRKIFCTHRRGLVVYTIDAPYYFQDTCSYLFSSPSYPSSWLYSLCAARRQIDKEKRTEIICMIFNPLNKLKVCKKKFI